MKQDLINDALHVAWGVWIVACVIALPPWLAAPLAILPREGEQTWFAMEERSWAGFRRHATWSWLAGKLRDLAGFAIGGLLVSQII